MAQEPAIYTNTEPTSEDLKAAEFVRPSASIIARFAKLPAANIGDVMDRLGVLDSKISPIWNGAKVAGPAFTVWTRSGDNLAIHRALAVAKPGDVIIVNGGADESRALIGDIMAGKAKRAGIAGIVIDGAARDGSGLAELEMPVFARALTPAGPYKFGPGKLCVTIAVGGVACAPGDIVVGDEDGVVVIPQAEALEILEAAEKVLEMENTRRDDSQQKR
jgi:regulator of RNase E activity RraA